MYDNTQLQPPSYGIYETPSTTYTNQPADAGQYEQMQYVNNSQFYQQQQPQQIYQTIPPSAPPPSYSSFVQQSQQPQQQQQQQLQQLQQPQQQQQQQQQQQPIAQNQYTQGTPFSPGYKWPRQAIQVRCPICGSTIQTRVETAITFITVFFAALLCLFTCILGLLPFCLPACKTTSHYCPYCNGRLGVRKPLR